MDHSFVQTPFAQGGFYENILSASTQRARVKLTASIIEKLQSQTGMADDVISDSSVIELVLQGGGVSETAAVLTLLLQCGGQEQEIIDTGLPILKFYATSLPSQANKPLPHYEAVRDIASCVALSYCSLALETLQLDPSNLHITHKSQVSFMSATPGDILVQNNLSEKSQALSTDSLSLAHQCICEGLEALNEFGQPARAVDEIHTTKKLSRDECSESLVETSQDYGHQVLRTQLNYMLLSVTTLYLDRLLKSCQALSPERVPANARRNGGKQSINRDSNKHNATRRGEKREEAIAVLKRTLWLLGTASQRVELMAYMRPELTSKEQIFLYDQPPVPDSELAEQELYDTALALIWEGYSKRWPHHIYHADKLLRVISERVDLGLDVLPERNACALLLGQAASAAGDVLLEPSGASIKHQLAWDEATQKVSPSGVLAHDDNTLMLLHSDNLREEQSTLEDWVQHWLELSVRPSFYMAAPRSTFPLPWGDPSGAPAERESAGGNSASWRERPPAARDKDDLVAEVAGGRLSVREYLSSPKVVLFNQVLQYANEQNMRHLTENLQHLSQEALQQLWALWKMSTSTLVAPMMGKQGRAGLLLQGNEEALPSALSEFNKKGPDLHDQAPDLGPPTSHAQSAQTLESQLQEGTTEPVSLVTLVEPGTTFSRGASSAEEKQVLGKCSVPADVPSGSCAASAAAEGISASVSPKEVFPSPDSGASSNTDSCLVDQAAIPSPPQSGSADPLSRVTARGCCTSAVPKIADLPAERVESFSANLPAERVESFSANLPAERVESFSANLSAERVESFSANLSAERVESFSAADGSEEVMDGMAVAVPPYVVVDAARSNSASSYITRDLNLVPSGVEWVVLPLSPLRDVQEHGDMIPRSHKGWHAAAVAEDEGSTQVVPRVIARLVDPQKSREQEEGRQQQKKELDSRWLQSMMKMAIKSGVVVVAVYAVAVAVVSLAREKSLLGLNKPSEKAEGSTCCRTVPEGRYTCWWEGRDGSSLKQQQSGNIIVSTQLPSSHAGLQEMITAAQNGEAGPNTLSAMGAARLLLSWQATNQLHDEATQKLLPQLLEGRALAEALAARKRNLREQQGSAFSTSREGVVVVAAAPPAGVVRVHVLQMKEEGKHLVSARARIQVMLHNANSLDASAVKCSAKGSKGKQKRDVAVSFRRGKETKRSPGMREVWRIVAVEEDAR
ncbi:hypothetical protein CEUSTIGMA_g9863.t1 [Chlamydomonas eustigma]|uniref:Plastid division protein CDP1-like 2nd alpha solenoid domain-containing protein n=1 Tax=Chlamydomonas eustigma TaxID=1157962 RepID=A0A250XH77_9CHLO|nr:hypothetical protein CEUSTIGMA_g9863.t1 [Chlamydomonas eustigma]|eukprot:GAX82435.1 hypothetical protein CEUSTIGMA_g9863.t1 [Chlamydomonas eustigma]